MNAHEILTDFARRPLEGAKSLPPLTSEQLNAHPAGHPNTITWLLWHTGRETDIQLSQLTGEAQQWVAYRDRFSLGELGDSIGYGHTSEDASRITVSDQGLLVDYVTATLTALIEYVSKLSETELDEVVDRDWEPAVTRGTRIVSIIDDASQHVGQAAYAAGAPTL